MPKVFKVVDLQQAYLASVREDEDEDTLEASEDPNLASQEAANLAIDVEWAI